MADNRASYGFRLYGLTTGGGLPKPKKEFVASAAAFNVSGGLQNAALRAGDVVKRVNDGSVTLCNGNETTPDTPFGVVQAVLPYYDSTIGQAGAMRPSKSLPSSVTYGTNLGRQSMLLVVPFDFNQIWEVDVNDNTTATTLAAYQALVGENVSFINSAAASVVPAWVAPKIAISTHATTASLWFVIAGVSDTMDNVDFTGNNVKLHIKLNPFAAATPSAATPTLASGT